MKTSLVRLLLAMASLAIIGCANSHSTPKSQKPHWVSHPTMETWVDQDGTFYPANWESNFPSPKEMSIRSNYSLLAFARETQQNHKERRRQIAAAEKSVLTQYGDYISNKKRIFVFIHGYNNDEIEANQAYERIKQRIAFRKSDGVIEFFWDGLTAAGARGGSIWFKATGNSQLVGSRGLRKLLNATHGKKVVVITHSRGASVFLSALSDPPYERNFVTDTKNSRWNLNVNGEPTLQPNDNRITALLLAPAIGYVDFKTKDKGKPMRDFDDQLEHVYYSVNSKDRVLGKFSGFFGLSKYFNPTDLGRNVEVAERVDAADKPRNRFRHQEWEPMTTHGFLTYVNHQQFVTMLKEAGIGVRD